MKILASNYLTRRREGAKGERDETESSPKAAQKRKHYKALSRSLRNRRGREASCSAVVLHRFGVVLRRAFLVPKLNLGTQLQRQFHCGIRLLYPQGPFVELIWPAVVREIEFRGQVRSQMEFGNERLRHTFRNLSNLPPCPSGS